MTGSTESGKISLVLYVDVEHGVLIETLWNVKLIAAAFAVSATPVLIETLWNVKNHEHDKQLRPGYVLIETLWNVKVVYEEDSLLQDPRINRNIVECKEGYEEDCECQMGAGINRNIVECKAVRASESLIELISVLIETLWNVKMFP